MLFDSIISAGKMQNNPQNCYYTFFLHYDFTNLES